MKRSLLALAALGAFAGAASAQSSVTLFGVVDLSVNYVKNGTAKSTTMESNQLNSNRLGFRGTEDLGGGLKAGFWLEAGLSPDNGNAGGANGSGSTTPAFFNRRSTVSLFGAFGEIRLGRDYTPSFWQTVFNDVDGANGLGQGNNLVLTSLCTSTNTPCAITFARTNNTVSYFLPSGLGGFYGQLQGAAGEKVSGQKYYGGRFGWAAGPVDINAGYGDTDVESFHEHFKNANVGGSYDFGVLKLFFFWNNVKFGGAKQDVYELSAGVPVGPGQLRASFATAKAKGTNPLGTKYDGQKADLASVEYVYDLSKRTALYTTLAGLKNKGGASFSVGVGLAPTDGSLVNGKSQGFNVGIRHSF